jgi:hypothetical protein
VSGNRATARAVGVLFILASVTAVVGGSLLLPLKEADYLTSAAGMRTQIVSGALIEMVLVLSVVGIAVLLFPVLRREHEGLALGYVAARTLEAVLLLAASMSALVVLSLSEAEARPGSEAAGSLALSIRDWTYMTGSLSMFGVSAVILYSLLYRANLVPVWLSLWGLAGGVLIVANGLAETYDVGLSSAVRGLLVAPIGLNEMVLAVWLIVKGFPSGEVATARDERRLADVPAVAP